VLQQVAAHHTAVSELDVRLFYHLYGERFRTSERRQIRHILITLNPDYPENTRAAALARIEHARDTLAGRPQHFAGLARRLSECPTAMEGGRLGPVVRGQIYPQLNQALFHLREGEISGVLESELGFHLLLCE